eukprot:8342176-Pyramimonas_sp.AAC.1
METDVEIINEGTTARERAAETAPQDNPRSKKAANPNAEDVDSWKNKPIFTCLPDKVREWSRPGPKDGTAKFLPSKGWGWRQAMWKNDILYARSVAVVTALQADLESTSQTIFQRLYSQVSQDPWT